MNYKHLTLPIAITATAANQVAAMAKPVSIGDREEQAKYDVASLSDYALPVKSASEIYILGILDKIKSFEFLDENWDGFGAVAPERGVVNNTIAFISALPQTITSRIKMENLVPTPYGTLVIDMAIKDELISIEVGENKIGFFSEFEDGADIKLKEKLFNQDNLPIELLDAIKKLYKEAYI